MTNDKPTPEPTHFVIEAFRRVHLAHPTNSNLMTTDDCMAWLHMGEVELDGPYPAYRHALNAWIEEQPCEPPVGRYRVIQSHSYGDIVQQFDIRERCERVIERVERTATYPDGSRDDTSRNLDVIADALAAPGFDDGDEAA